MTSVVSNIETNELPEITYNELPELSYEEALSLKNPSLIFMVEKGSHLDTRLGSRITHHFLGAFHKYMQRFNFQHDAWIKPDESGQTGFVLSVGSNDGEYDVRNIMRHPVTVGILVKYDVISVEESGFDAPVLPVNWQAPKFKYREPKPD